MTRGAGSGAGRVVSSRFASGRMGRKRSLARIDHPEHARARPRPPRFNGRPGAMVFRVILLKVRQYPLSAIAGPDC